MAIIMKITPCVVSCFEFLDSSELSVKRLMGYYNVITPTSRQTTPNPLVQNALNEFATNYEREWQMDDTFAGTPL